MEHDKSHQDFVNGLTPDIMEGYLKGTLSPEMREKVDQYLKENPFEAEAMDGLKSYSMDLNRELTELNQRLSDKILPKPKKYSRYLWAAAAAVSLVVVSSLVILLLLPGKEDSSPIAVNQDITDLRDQGVVDLPITPAPVADDEPTKEPQIEPQASEELSVTSTKQPKSDQTPTAPAEVTNFEETVAEETVVEEVEQASSITNRTKANQSATGIAAARANREVDLPMAQAPDNWNEYLMQNLEYPPEALSKGIEGIVGIKFQVDTAGKPINFQLINPVGYGCDQEAIRLLEQGPPWTPVQVNGLPVISNAEIEINFQYKKDH
jgi:protein TonB